MKYKNPKVSAGVILSLLFGGSAPGTILITSLSPTYSQDFNSLSSSHLSDPTWEDNSTIAGWHLHSGPSFNPDVTNLRVRTDSSSGSDRAHVSYGDTVEDRALGLQPGSSHRYSLSSAASGEVFGSISVALQNGTGVTLTGFSFSYTGEQWHITSNREEFDTLNVDYAIDIGGGTLFNSLDWQSLAGATFLAPQHSTTGGVNFAGNLAANRTTGLGSSVTGLEWQPDEVLWIRWSTLNYSGSDNGMAIDDFSFSAIPEPSSITILGGFIAIFAVSRRRSRHFYNQQ